MPVSPSTFICRSLPARSIHGGGILPLSRFILCTSFLTVLLYPRVSSAQTGEKWVVRVVSVQGTVEAQRMGGTQWQPVRLNDTYSPGDTIRVQERSRAALALLDQSVLHLNANTTLTLRPVKEEFARSPWIGMESH